MAGQAIRGRLVSPCPRCSGKGKAPWHRPDGKTELVRCGLCQGKGTVESKATPKVKKRSKVQ